MDNGKQAIGDLRGHITRLWDAVDRHDRRYVATKRDIDEMKTAIEALTAISAICGLSLGGIIIIALIRFVWEAF